MSTINEKKLLPASAAKTMIENVENLERFIYRPVCPGEVDGVTPKQLVQYLHKYKNTLQHLELEYFGTGLHNPRLEDKAFAIGSGLAEFTKLESLDLGYGALVDSEPVKPFLPNSISSFTLRWCPLDADMDFLKAIVALKQQNMAMTMQIDFLCDWEDLGHCVETKTFDQGKSKLDKGFTDLAEEFGVKLSCAGAEP
jgi:hypothetical protein